MLVAWISSIFITDILWDSQENICNKIGLILSFSLILIWGARLPVVSISYRTTLLYLILMFKVRIGRIAGQYAKPRSNPFEIVDGRKVLSFRLFFIVFEYLPFAELHLYQRR